MYGCKTRFVGVIASVLAVVFAVACTKPSTAQPLITDLRSGQIAATSRLVIETTEIVPVSLLLLVEPYRLVIDMGEALLVDEEGKVVTSGAGDLYAELFHGYRFGVIPVRGGTNTQARLVIDLSTTATLEQIHWLPEIDNKKRLVIDLADRGATAFRVAAQALLANRHIPLLESAAPVPPSPPQDYQSAYHIARVPPPPSSAQKGITPPPETIPSAIHITPTAPPPSGKPGVVAPPLRPGGGGREIASEIASAVTPPPTPPASPLASNRQDKWVVVIDAGHGGKDSGAIGVSGIKEKDITLAAAKELARLMAATGKITPILSREDDRFHHLQKRVLFARQHQADVFISLHADAAPSPRAHGVSVFTLSNQASDAEADILARQENKADLIGGPDLGTTDPEITPVLLRIFQREAMNQSSGLADVLLKAYRGLPTSIQRGHRFAGFVVLKAPDIPSVLIEMGFLTNASDEQHLRSDSYRRDLLRRTTGAVVEFLERSQPRLPSQVPNV